jgi:type II secretory pathway predicted ATPase ExeA
VAGCLRASGWLISARPDCRSYLITGECRTGKEASVSIAREGLENSDHALAAGDSHFFAGAIHVEALARLEHLVESGCRSGIVVGPRGTGKSTVLNVFAQDCRAAGCEALSIDVTGLDGVQFLERLAQRLEVTSRARRRVIALWSEVADALAGRALAGRRCVLMVDHLDRAMKDCQHLVSRLSTRGYGSHAETWILAFSGRLFPMVPREWREHNELRIELGPLSERESHAFLQSLLAFVNCPRDAFDETADALVAAASGIPADLARLVELAGLLADGSQTRVSPEEFGAVLDELRGLRFSA